MAQQSLFFFANFAIYVMKGSDSMIIFKPSVDLTEKDKQQISEMSGKIVLWILEGRSNAYMADQLHLHPQQFNHNVDQLLYDLRKHVGIWRFIKILFKK